MIQAILFKYDQLKKQDFRVKKNWAFCFYLVDTPRCNIKDGKNHRLYENRKKIKNEVK